MPVGTVGLGFSSPPLHPDPLWDNAVNEAIHLVISEHSVDLTTHLHLLHWLRMHGGLPPQVFVASVLKYAETNFLLCLTHV